MNDIDFQNHYYFPVLSSGDIEANAYDQLTEETKSSILPVLEVCRRRNDPDMSHSIEILGDRFTELPILLDLDKREAPEPYRSQNPTNVAEEDARVAQEQALRESYNEELRRLLRSQNGFQNWREFASQFPNAIPVLQFTNPSSQRLKILRQAALLSTNGGKICLRIREPSSEIVCEIAAEIISLIGSSEQLLIIFDCGQGRRGVEEKIAWMVRCLELISASVEIGQLSDLTWVSMSNSYPQPNHAGLRTTENLDWDIWRGASEGFELRFGDYAANYRQPRLNSFVPRHFRATVVHSKDESWLVHRDEDQDNSEGWAIGCREIVSSADNNFIDSECDEAIEEVAVSGIGEFSSSRHWHAFRTSGHIERQSRYAEAIFEEFHLE